MRHEHHIQNPPRTIMEVYQSLPEGTLAELIEGILYMSPAPSPTHQLTSGEIYLQLAQYVKKHHLGKVMFAPVDVYLDESANAVQPDIIFIAESGRTRLSREGIYGAPELVLEILSMSNAAHDLVTKKSLYERFGVKEYWIVDPETKETTGFFLEGGTYQPISSSPGKLNTRIFNQEFTF